MGLWDSVLAAMCCEPDRREQQGPFSSRPVNQVYTVAPRPITCCAARDDDATDTTTEVDGPPTPLGPYSQNSPFGSQPAPFGKQARDHVRPQCVPPLNLRLPARVRAADAKLESQFAGAKAYLQANNLSGSSRTP